ncbi:MAG TPA: amidohydrolase family protein [Usitatibacter sp.]|nr:amidohydrolase family protein [Usitatibacter sp.]
MRRRAFLRSAAVAPLLALGGCRFSFEQGLFADCTSASALLREPIVLRAWEGLRADRVWDMHAHLFGNGRSGGGIWVERDYDRPQSLGARVRHRFYMNGGCVGDDEDQLDQGMVSRLLQVVDELPAGAKLMLLAFDFTFDDRGARREDLTTFSVPNAYARRIAQSRPERFEWIASVHPCRPDAVAQLEAAKAAGARAVKWLPPAMGIDLRARKSLELYDAMKRLDIPLLVHVGEEQAVPGARRHELANPLFLRAPLDRGVRVIAAHCATLGESLDLDANANPDKAPRVADFDLFVRLMEDRRYEGFLFGDLSAVTQANRAAYLPRLLGKREWHGRLLNGSDYPLPGILPLFSLDALVRQSVLDEAAVPTLRKLRHANALLFDFVLKRNLRLGAARFPTSAFETRGFFVKPGSDHLVRFSDSESGLSGLTPA